MEPAQTPSPAPTVPALVSAYIERYFQTFPSLATQAGRHDLDRQLEDLSAARRADWLRFNRDTLEKLTAAVKAGGLPLDDRLDAEALTGQLQQEILAQAVVKRPERDPLYWTGIIENANVFLLVRDDLPLADRLARVVDRTTLLPRLARQARDALGGSAPSADRPGTRENRRLPGAGVGAVLRDRSGRRREGPTGAGGRAAPRRRRAPRRR